MTTTEVRTEYVDEELLARFDERAPKYDHDNEFFTEDFEELRDRGYFLASLPAEYGGAGLDLKAINAIQRRIAYVAPATAVAVNMHHYWVGMCADMHRAGDHSARLGAREGGRGPHLRRRSRRGRQRPAAAALHHEGRAGRRRLGDHRPQDLRLPLAGVDLPRLPRQDNSDPENPKIVHGFLHRDTPRLPDRGDVGHASACGPRCPTTRSSTRRSSPTRRRCS